MDERIQTPAAIAALLLTLLTMSCLGCATRGVGHATYAPSGGGWVRVTPPGAGVAVEMPGAPHLTRSESLEDDGTPVVITTLRSDTGYGSFGLMVAEFEGGTVGDPGAVARDVAAGMLGELEIDATRSERLDSPGFYARQDVGAHRQGLVVGVRQFVGARRIYVAIAAVPSRPDLLALADRFMGSIELDPSDRLFAAAGPAQPTEIAGAPASWGPVYSPGEAFAVEMPAVAEVQTSTLALPSGDAAQRTFEGRAPGATYRVRVIALDDPGAAGRLDEVAAALSLGEAVGPVHASGFGGREHRAVSDAPRVSRVFTTASRIYVLETTGASERAARFFDSFRIL